MRHMHDPNGCDIIVCWEHNWPECPLEVIELKKEIAKLRKNKTLPLMNADDTDQRRELPQMDADERGLGRDNFGRMVMKPIQRDLELLGQSHAKME